jgi:hypothetical protein
MQSMICILAQTLDPSARGGTEIRAESGYGMVPRSVVRENSTVVCRRAAWGPLAYMVAFFSLQTEQSRRVSSDALHQHLKST